MEWFSPSKLTADSEYQINGVNVKICLLKNHNLNNIKLPTKRTKAFKGVVIHNTNRAQSADDGRQYTAATLNGAMASRTHFYVTELGAWQNLELDEMNWTCGDGIVGQGNNGCISLEIIMNSKNKTEDLKARDNGAKIAAYLLYKNNMTINDMYTHNYFLNIRDGVKGDYNKLCTTATPTRNCPYYIVWDWENFRKQVNNYLNQLKGVKTSDVAPQASKKKRYIYRAISQAAMRTQPSKTSTILQRVTRGCYYIAEDLGNGWIKHEGSDTYSMLKDGSELFDKIGDCVILKAKSNLNIRQAPTTKSNSIIVVQKGATVGVFDEKGIGTEGHIWKRVVLNNRIGYVASEYLENE